MKLRSLIVPMLLLAACQSTPVTRADVDKLLDDQVAAWNRGDLTGFLASYSRGGELTMLTRAGALQGFEAIQRRYREGWPGADDMGELTFDVLEVRSVGRDAALVLGRFRVAGIRPSEGFFTLLIERVGEDLVITHDHTTKASA